MSMGDGAWRFLDGSRRGTATGLVIYAVIFVLASALCLAEYAGVSEEGYVGAGWMLLFFGLPLTAIEAFLESLDLSLSQQLFNLYALAFLNWLVVGSVAGHFVGRSRRGQKWY